MQIPVMKRGFTLIELVVVITLLGVLAAFAVPRFANLHSEARAAALRGMVSSSRSASALAHSLYLSGQSGGPDLPVQMEGQAISMFNGYPDAPGMVEAARLVSGSGFQMNVFGNVAIIVQGDNAASWLQCGFVYIRSVPPSIPVPRYLGPNTAGC